MEDKTITQELINTGLVDEYELRYMKPQKSIQKHIDNIEKKSPKTISKSFYILSSIIATIICALPIVLFSAWTAIITIPLFLAFLFVMFIVDHLKSLSAMKETETYTFDMIESLINVRLSDGTVCYTYGFQQDETRLVTLKDEDVPALREYILSKNDRTSNDFYIISEDNRDEYKMGSTQSLTIDLEKKFIKYRWFVY